jgi:hypothetical protein
MDVKFNVGFPCKITVLVGETSVEGAKEQITWRVGENGVVIIDLLVSSRCGTYIHLNNRDFSRENCACTWLNAYAS